MRTFKFWGCLSPWQDLPSDQRIKRISSKTALWTHPPGKGDVYSTSIMEQIWVCHACEAGSCFAHDRLGRVTLLCFHRCVTSGLTKSPAFVVRQNLCKSAQQYLISPTVTCFRWEASGMLLSSTQNAEPTEVRGGSVWRWPPYSAKVAVWECLRELLVWVCVCGENWNFTIKKDLAAWCVFGNGQSSEQGLCRVLLSAQGVWSNGEAAHDLIRMRGHVLPCYWVFFGRWGWGLGCLFYGPPDPWLF